MPMLPGRGAALPGRSMFTWPLAAASTAAAEGAAAANPGTDARRMGRSAARAAIALAPGRGALLEEIFPVPWDGPRLRIGRRLGYHPLAGTGSLRRVTTAPRGLVGLASVG